MLGNICIKLGQRIGAETLYKYYQAFGFFDKTGIDLPQEASSTYWKLEDVKDVELATMSFGQRFTITPIQLVSAVSAIANDGILMKPRIVKQIINPETGTTTDIEPVQVRQVISKSTSERMRNLMKSVVDDGSGRLAKVEGYSIGGKTGTSEPQAGREDEGYIASYVRGTPYGLPVPSFRYCRMKDTAVMSLHIRPTLRTTSTTNQRRICRTVPSTGSATITKPSYQGMTLLRSKG